jgi:hypothetical protein
MTSSDMARSRCYFLLGGMTLTKKETYFAPRVFLTDNVYEASSSASFFS